MRQVGYLHDLNRNAWSTKHKKNFDSVFLDRLDRRNNETKFRLTPNSLPPPKFSVFLITLTFPSTLKTFLLFVSVATLSRCPFTVNCSSRNVESHCTFKVNWHYQCHLQAWNLCSYMKSFRACPVKDRKMLEFPKHRTAWNIMLEGMIGNVVISEVDTLT